MRAHAPTPHAMQLLGDHLRETRVKQRVTREFLSEWIGLDRTTVKRIEQGGGLLLVSHLSAMELALGLRPGVSFEVLAGAAAGSPHARPPLPSSAPTLRELSIETTLCGHAPPCSQEGTLR